MSIFNRSASGPALHFHDFIKKVHAYHCDKWSDEELRIQLHRHAGNGAETAEATSILKEIIRRKTGLSLFDSQLMTAYSMSQGRIAELPTGEGKTLAAVVTAAILALQSKSVHILVFNDYLAKRDYEENKPIYQACGLRCGYIIAASDFAHRKAAYACDVVYITAKEAGFDCLRDFLCTEKERLLCPPLQVALVDEADSIMIDEARIPLVLAGDAETTASTVLQIASAVSRLPGDAVGIIRESNQVWLTETGVQQMEASLRIDNLFTTEHAGTLAMIHAAIEARFLLHKDIDYIVRDGEVLVVDAATGRVAENRRFPDLLHHAVEVQALGSSGTSSAVYNTMSMQAYLRQYEMLCGMTGTAASSAYEFRQMYALEIDVIPPHIPCIRIDHPDAIYMEKMEQEAAILGCIQAAHAKGQPVLLGTQSVQESEHYSILLANLGIKHAVLNARNDAQEAAVVANAGEPYQVTISTNMAGRGVDIRLGGHDERDAAFVHAAGGLYVISTGINRSVRIDNQLRGRAGRQGNPGESKFFVCLADLTVDSFMGIEYSSYKRYPTLLRRAQRAQEASDIEARYMLERYSNIVEAQRKRISAHRLHLLLDQHTPDIVQNEAPALYHALTSRVGMRGVTLAEKQLTLYFINMHWASYLAALEDMRDGIHLTVIGRKDPLHEYMLFAGAGFEEMLEDIKADIIRQMQQCEITEDGIDMEKAGLLGATTTWTYMINESTTQFSVLPRIIGSVSNSVKGTLFTFRGLLTKLKSKL